MSLVAVPHGECASCGHSGELVDVVVIAIAMKREAKGCSKCYSPRMKRRWVVEKEKT
ncbi:hypothetical protein PBI_SUZY_71 [Gordonia phage Suzy]|uniref:Uncharacterized protein n=1 Tax=Gordonia phage Suzy TaxID=2201430 RepID=A0A2Z4Q8K1_9CAUD|nr:hypothetical protein HOT44_gp71 [Gordonia phage Suzy]AWY06175.1 hypothetical protein PBI_SUZY_71 [Gordonia phage Suzy]